MLKQLKRGSPVPPQSSWVGSYNFPMKVLERILVAFMKNESLAEENEMGEIDINYMLSDSISPRGIKRIDVYIDHLGIAPVLSGFILGWETREGYLP